jgi:hypothetical protein
MEDTTIDDAFDANVTDVSDVVDVKDVAMSGTGTCFSFPSLFFTTLP